MFVTGALLGSAPQSVASECAGSGGTLDGGSTVAHAQRWHVRPVLSLATPLPSLRQSRLKASLRRTRSKHREKHLRSDSSQKELFCEWISLASAASFRHIVSHPRTHLKSTRSSLALARGGARLRHLWLATTAAVQASETPKGGTRGTGTSSGVSLLVGGLLFRPVHYFWRARFIG